ncbi:hypothetical protein [Comamonas sp.]|nr:hypothetical protein [Comamonas sp.]
MNFDNRGVPASASTHNNRSIVAQIATFGLLDAMNFLAIHQAG